MPALKNATHGLILTLWAVAGLLMSTKALFSTGPSTLAVVGFWVWFGGLAALTTWLVSHFKAASSALFVHAGTFVVLNALPMSVPFGLLRYGMDVFRFTF